MFAVIAAGQGAQTPRMLASWVREPRAHDLLTEWSEAADVDLIGLGTHAGADEIARTENTQPLLVAQALLAGSLFTDTDRRWVVAGHSVGELSAAAFAGVLTPVDAVRLARVRGLVMAEACAEHPTGMAAVVGGEAGAVLAHLHQHGLFAANFNGRGQVVAAGSLEDLAALAQRPPAGSAVKPLAVAGAFHTPFMASARDRFAWATADAAFCDARHPMVSNLDGSVVTSGAEIQRRLIAQITAPVRWDRCLATLDDLDPDVVIATPPGKVLAGIMARQLPHRNTITVNVPRDLVTAERRLAGLTSAPVPSVAETRPQQPNRQQLIPEEV